MVIFDARSKDGYRMKCAASEKIGLKAFYPSPWTILSGETLGSGSHPSRRPNSNVDCESWMVVCTYLPSSEYKPLPGGIAVVEWPVSLGGVRPGLANERQA